MKPSRFFPLIQPRDLSRSRSATAGGPLITPGFNENVAAFSPLPLRRRGSRISSSNDQQTTNRQTSSSTVGQAPVSSHTNGQQQQKPSGSSNRDASNQQHCQQYDARNEEQQQQRGSTCTSPGRGEGESTRRGSNSQATMMMTTPTRNECDNITSSDNNGKKRTHVHESGRFAAREGSRCGDEQTNEETSMDMLTCTICLSEICEAAEIESCQHRFCRTCIIKWAKVSNSCPLCNGRFSTIKLVHNHEAAETTHAFVKPASGASSFSSSSSVVVRSRWFTSNSNMQGKRTRDSGGSGDNDSDYISGNRNGSIGRNSAQQGRYKCNRLSGQTVEQQEKGSTQVIRIQAVDHRGVPDPAEYESVSGHEEGGEGENAGQDRDDIDGYEYDDFVVHESDPIDYEYSDENDPIAWDEDDEDARRSGENKFRSANRETLGIYRGRNESDIAEDDADVSIEDVCCTDGVRSPLRDMEARVRRRREQENKERHRRRQYRVLSSTTSTSTTAGNSGSIVDSLSNGSLGSFRNSESTISGYDVSRRSGVRARTMRARTAAEPPPDTLLTNSIRVDDRAFGRQSDQQLRARQERRNISRVYSSSSSSSSSSSATESVVDLCSPSPLCRRSKTRVGTTNDTDIPVTTGAGADTGGSSRGEATGGSKPRGQGSKKGRWRRLRNVVTDDDESDSD